MKRRANRLQLCLCYSYNARVFSGHHIFYKTSLHATDKLETAVIFRPGQIAILQDSQQAWNIIPRKLSIYKNSLEHPDANIISFNIFTNKEDKS